MAQVKAAVQAPLSAAGAVQATLSMAGVGEQLTNWDPLKDPESGERATAEHG